MGTEHEVLIIVGEKGKVGKTEIIQRLGISHGYADLICRSLIREGYLRVEEGKYYTLEPRGAKTLLSEGWKLSVDRRTLEEVARGVAKEVVREIKTLPIRPSRPRAIGVRERDEEKEIQIKTSFIPPIELEDVEMESNIEKVTTAEKDKFDIGGAVEAFKRVKGR